MIEQKNIKTFLDLFNRTGPSSNPTDIPFAPPSGWVGTANNYFLARGRPTPPVSSPIDQNFDDVVFVSNALVVKSDTRIFSVDSFGLHAEEIKKSVTKYDEHYHGKYKPFTKKTRFKDFSHLEMTEEINKILSEKNSKLETLVGYFTKLKDEDMDKIKDLKFSFVHLDFDLYQSTIDTFNFIKVRLEKNARSHLLLWR